MGQVIEVDFTNGEVLHGVDEYDREVARLWEDYHRACELGRCRVPGTYPRQIRSFLAALWGEGEKTNE